MLIDTEAFRATVVPIKTIIGTFYVCISKLIGLIITMLIMMIYSYHGPHHIPLLINYIEIDCMMVYDINIVMIEYLNFHVTILCNLRIDDVN